MNYYFLPQIRILCYGQCIYKQCVQCDHDIRIFTIHYEKSYIYGSAMSFVFAFLRAYYNLLEKKKTLDLLCMLYYLCFSKRKLRTGLSAGVVDTVHVANIGALGK